jgi:hypothetical protein
MPKDYSRTGYSETVDSESPFRWQSIGSSWPLSGRQHRDGREEPVASFTPRSIPSPLPSNRAADSHILEATELRGIVLVIKRGHHQQHPNRPDPTDPEAS